MQATDGDGGPCHVVHSKRIRGAHASGVSGFVVLDVSGSRSVLSRRGHCAGVKQIKLTDKHIQGFMAAYEDIAKVYDGAESDKPEDPKVEAQAAAVAKKHGFAGLAQYDDVSMNITMIMSGIDPQTKKFTEPPEQIKNEIAALKADKSVPGGPGAARGGAQDGKAHSVQGKHRAGAQVLRPARAHHARTRFETATSGLETHI
jgi:hypothetical protein